MEPGPQLLVECLRDIGLNTENKNLRSVILIDVHTGLGPFAHDTLLMDNKHKEKMRMVQIDR